MAPSDDRTRPPARRPGRLAAVVGLLTAILGSCGDAADPPAPVDPSVAVRDIAPGVSLLELLDRARLVDVPDSSLPPEVAAWLGRRPSSRVAAGDWGPGRTLDDGASQEKWFPAMMGLTGTSLTRWRVRPALRPDMPLGSVTLEHEGRTCTRIGWHGIQVDPDRDRVWWDEDARLAFWWDPVGAALLAFGERAPGDIVLSYAGDDGALSRFERGGSGDVLARLSRHVLADVSRPALLLPAPAALEIDVPAGGAEGLRVAVGLPDHGYEEVDGALLPSPGASDGVDCIVEWEGAAGVRELWRRRLAPGEGWVREVVAWPDQDLGPGVLRLRVDPGPDGDRWFDYALWADLRLTGEALPDPRPHLLLIDIDTLRADRVGPHRPEGARDTSPWIDRWAAEHAVVYTDAVATAPWTVPSTLSLLTGLDVLQHDVTHREKLRRGLVALATRLRAAGYETVAATGGGYLVPAFGFDDGFDAFRWANDMDGTLDGSALLDALAQRDGPHPVFAFLHTYMVHAPYLSDPRFEDAEAPYDGPYAGERVGYNNMIEPHRRGLARLTAEDREYLVRMYDAGVARMDEALGAFLEAWFERVPRGSTAIVLTSDHGEELFDHGQLNHGHSLHAELLRVPLIVEFPEGTGPGPGVESRPVSTLDIVPTLLELAGAPVPEVLPGVSLLAELPTERPRVAVLGNPGKGLAGAALEYRDAKLIQDAHGVRLYRISDDPTEQHDLAARHPDRVRQLEDLLEQYRELHPPLSGEEAEVHLDAETEASLRALGYLGDDEH